jgi:hypothetical protein
MDQLTWYTVVGHNPERAAAQEHTGGQLTQDRGLPHSLRGLTQELGRDQHGRQGQEQACDIGAAGGGEKR